MPDESQRAKPAQQKLSEMMVMPAYATAFEGTQKAGARWLENLMALSQEVARFAQERLQDDLTQWRALSACHTPQEAIECQRRYAAKVGEEYAQELGKIGQIVMNATTEEPSRPASHA